MTLKDLRRYCVSENYNTLVFSYAGKDSGVEPTAHNSVISFKAWHGDATKDYTNVDALLTDKFFSGKSLSDLVKTVDFEFC